MTAIGNKLSDLEIGMPAWLLLPALYRCYQLARQTAEYDAGFRVWRAMRGHFPAPDTW